MLLFFSPWSVLTDSRSRLHNYITNTLSASESAALTITLTLTDSRSRSRLIIGRLNAVIFFTLVSAHRLTLTLTQLHHQHSARSHSCSCSRHVIGRLNAVIFFTSVSGHRLTLTLTQLHHQHVVSIRVSRSHSRSCHIISRLNAIIFFSPQSVITDSRSRLQDAPVTSPIFFIKPQRVIMYDRLLVSSLLVCTHTFTLTLLSGLVPKSTIFA